MPTDDVLERAEEWIRIADWEWEKDRTDEGHLIYALAVEVRELRRFREWVGDRERAKWEEFRAAMKGAD